ncbi:hypothetical protein DM01DRAFT_1153525 [Hesseltinella vesiculosa]|uniref:AHC1-like C2H2 zinc-finger domain-containing protein n=1 Tax=Hesseltinella vesiculosa TaxID=101127 RepID=A0A1X2G6K0_9FUNG|nr:hypothetical protein DM01DRAFT_1153525 [Hesseltinella vesiculosa]
MFDAEVFLKHRELAAIQIEIEKAESIIHDLDLSIKNESYAAFLPNLPHYTRRTASAIGYGRSVSSNNNSAKSNTTKQNQSSVLFGRRSDGVYVKLACPACHRENFSNQLGFLNHCRISHSLEFGPYENVMIQCGTPVEETEVPEDHPVRNRPLPLPILPM